VHVTTGGENIRVTDQVSTRGGHEELSVEELHDSTELIVCDNLLQAEFKRRDLQTFFLDFETSIAQRLDPRLFSAHHLTEHGTEIGEDGVDFLDTAIRLVDCMTRARTAARRFSNLSVQLSTSLRIQCCFHGRSRFTADRGGNDTGKSLDLVLRTIELGNMLTRVAMASSAVGGTPTV
jgi:hypothetical protein